MHHTTHQTTINGTEVLFIHVPNARAVFFSINIFSGYRYAITENVQHFHIPHLLEHMVFEGSQNYPAPELLMDQLSKDGAYFNGMTNNYINQYHVRTAPDEIDRIIPVMFDMVYRPLLLEKGLDEEREVVMREYEEMMSDYSTVASLMNGLQSLPKSGVNLFEQADLLELVTLAQIKNYHQKFYTAKNSQIIISGDLPEPSRKKILTMLRHQLKLIPEGKRHTLPLLRLSKPELPALPIEVASEISTVHVSLSFITKGTLAGKEYQPLGLFGNLVGTTDYASIYHYLRKKGLLYSLNSSTVTSPSTHEIQIDFVCDRASYAKTLLELLTKLKAYAEAVHDDTIVERLKQNVAGSIALSCETSTDYSQWYEEYLIHKEPLLSPESIAASIHDTSPEEIYNTSSKLVQNKNLFITIMGGDASEYLDLTHFIRESVFGNDQSNVDEILESIAQEEKKLAQSRPMATWLARIGLTLLSVSSFIPNIIGFDGKQYSLWTFGLENGTIGINVTIFWLIVTTISMYFLRFGAVVKELFLTASIYYLVLLIVVFGLSNSDADIPDLLGQITAMVMFLTPLFLILGTIGPTATWLINKLKRYGKRVCHCY